MEYEHNQLGEDIDKLAIDHDGCKKKKLSLVTVTVYITYIVKETISIWPPNLVFVSTFCGTGDEATL